MDAMARPYCPLALRITRATRGSGADGPSTLMHNPEPSGAEDTDPCGRVWHDGEGQSFPQGGRGPRGGGCQTPPSPPLPQEMLSC